MVKVIVIFDSSTGFTELMAQAVVEGAQAVSNTEVELLKVGEPFSLRRVETADAVIFGAPNIYNNITPGMKSFLENMNEIKEYLQLPGKIGGVFESYGWDKGQVIQKLNAYLVSFGMKTGATPLSIAHRTVAEAYIDEDIVQQCRALGKTIAEQAAT